MDILGEIVKRLRDEETRWDAILQLKIFDGTHALGDLLALLSDPDWVIRWSVAEKLGDMKAQAAIGPLVKLLVDPDAHVRKNAMKALVKFGQMAIPVALPYLAHENVAVRRQVLSLFLNIGRPASQVLEKLLPDANWVISNRILDVIWRLGGPGSETALIRALSNPFTQNHAIVLLGIIKSKRAVPYLMKAFEIPKLRRIVIYSLYRIGEAEAYPVIVKSIHSSSGGVASLAEKIVRKVGAPILPYLMWDLSRDVGIDEKERIVRIMFKIGISDIQDRLKQLMREDPEVRQVVEKIRDSK